MFRNSLQGSDAVKPLGTFSALVGLLIAGFAFSVSETPLAKPASPAVNSLPSLIFVEAPTVQSGELAMRFPRGSRLVRLDRGTSGRSLKDLTEGFFAAADPRISPDESRVLFAGQKTRGGRWQIWEMSADGSGKRQITHGAGDCFQPVFLPRGEIAFTMVTGKGASRTSEIHVSNANGEEDHPITFGPGDFQVETVLQSGRILVSAESVLSGHKENGQSKVFYLLRPDGSGLSLFRSEDQPGVLRSGATELSDGTILFVKRISPQTERMGGRLAWIRPQALHNSVLTPADLGIWSAHALDGNTLVVSMRKGGNSSGEGTLGLYAFDLATHSAGEMIYGNPGASSVEAVPLEPHPVPLYYWSILHPDRDYGRVVCLDAYISADAKGGRLTTRIARVRVIALQSGRHGERVLGEAPVESDGSFYIKIPANLPVRFELLDAKGSVIRAQQSWVWARNGEDVGCVGCHESRAVVPGNHWPLALKRMDTPTPVGISGRVLTAGH